MNRISPKEIEVLRKLSPQARFRIGLELHEMAINVSIGAIKERNPQINESDLLQKLKERVSC